MITYRSDLHVHTVLSPCAGIEMIPPLIVEEALDRGIQLIAITDHNASANVAAVQQAARGSALTALPGMELQTREEVHLLCLFDTLEQLAALQQWVDQRLPTVSNNPDYFGEQFIVDSTGDFIAREERLLINSVDASLEQAYAQVNDLGGILIPAHINRTAFGLLPVLGLVPGSVQIEALEISRHITPDDARRTYPQTAAFPLIQNGDVHYLDGYLGSTLWTLERISIAELRLALRSQDGRTFSVEERPTAGGR